MPGRTISTRNGAGTIVSLIRTPACFSLPLAGSPMVHRTAMPGGSIPDTNPYRKE
jgi:hypothetical protein